MKRYFHKELESVRSNLMLMGEKSIENVNRAMEALVKSDVSVCDRLIESDDEIDAIETQIDDEVVRYVSLRAPVARDLRLLFVAVKASHDLERVGDEATSIANRAKTILEMGEPIDLFGSMPRMCEMAVGMLQDALFCFIKEQEERAFSIFDRDREVDSLNRQNFQEFTNVMKSDPERAAVYTELVFISKSFERIADHAKNIAEEVYYLLTTKSLKDALRNRNGDSVDHGS